MARVRVGSDGSTSASEAPQSAPAAAPRASGDQEFAKLREVVEKAYDEGTTLEEAERLAARFLGAQMQIAEELANLDLDTRMKKNGLKAKRSQTYMLEATKGEKKPSEGFLENHVNMDLGVQNAANEYETADARKENLLLYFGIFKDAHIYFRGIAKGRFE